MVLTKLVHVGLSGAFLMLPPSAAMRIADPGSLGTLLPYGSAPATLEPVPAGYKPVFVESLNRHGSRALATPANVDNALSLWRQASTAGALTPLGQQFGADAQKLLDANVRLGFGNLSSLGQDELRGIGSRTAARLPRLFGRGSSVDLVTSGVPRAIQSAKSFAKGLLSVAPGTDVNKPVTDTVQLQFDHTDPSYVGFLADDRRTSQALRRIDGSPAAIGAARHVLGRLYSPAFTKRIPDPLAAARAIYGVYAIAPGMAKETSIRFDRYVPAVDASELAYIADAHYFYESGPGIKGRADSFAPAKVVLDDFFSAIDDRLAGGRTTAVFRFAHAEQLAPFAALLQLPGSEKPAGPDADYAPGNNPWRGSEVARLGSNVQWIVYSRSGSAPIVAVLDNEQSVSLGDSCRPIGSDSNLYELDELKRCLPR